VFSIGNKLGAFPRFFLSAVLLALFAPMFWQQTQLPSGAPQARTHENVVLYERIFPAFQYTSIRMAGGELPLWNDAQLCGVPHFANPQNALYQPLNMLFLVFPIEKALVLHGYLALFLMGMGFMLYARALGLRYIPALYGATAYACCGVAAASISRPEIANTLVWLPFSFWTLRAYLYDGRASYLVLAGIMWGLLIFAGAWSLLPAIFLLQAGYVAFGAWNLPRLRNARAPHPLRALCAILLLGLAFSAIQWLPTLLWIRSLDAPLVFLSQLGLDASLPSRLKLLAAQLLNAPGAGVLPPAAYFGITSLLLLPAAYFHRQRAGEAIFFTLAGLFTLVIATTGRNVWDGAAPFEAFLIPAAFSITVLAALGADRLFITGRDPRSPLVWAPVLLVAVLAALLVFPSSTQSRGVIAVFLFLLLPSALIRVRWVTNASALLAILLLFVDLASSSPRRHLHPIVDLPAAHEAAAPALRAAEEQALGDRIVLSAVPLDPNFPINHPASAGIRAAGGRFWPLSGAQRLWWESLLPPGKPIALDDPLMPSPEAAHPSLLNFMAARALLATPDAAMASGVWKLDGPTLLPALNPPGARLYINQQARPRAYWVPEWMPADTTEAAIARLTEPGFQPARACVVEARGRAFRQLNATPPPPVPADFDVSTANCAILSATPERVTIEVGAPRAGITVLADSFDAGWRATLNGERVPILRVNALFRGVATPPGKHILEFRYQPYSRYLGAAISMGTLALCLLGGLWQVSRKRV